ncbi:barstar family protein [Streptomyces phaeofaciens JCM 4814]|nr:hypothetical protein [Streptomyces phaeofaciens]
MSDGPRFALFDESGEIPLAFCADVTGFFYGSNPGHRAITLRKCTPTPALAEVAGQARKEQVDLSIKMLDTQGRPLAGELICGVEVGTPRRSGEAHDVVVSGTLWSAPTVAARPIWERWCLGRPETNNRWAAYAPNGREAWLSLVCRQPRRTGPDAQHRTYQLDGRYITDLTSFYLAFGEAINGPGGSYGAGFFWFWDSFKGGAGAIPPFTVVWNDWQVAAPRLRYPYHPVGGTPSDCFAMTVAGLREIGVEVVLP